MAITRMDAKRRIVLPREIADRYGDKFVIVTLPNGEILLKPLPKDPLATLKEEGRKMKGFTAAQVKKDFEEAIRRRISK